MTETPDDLRILVPPRVKQRLDAIQEAVQAAAGRRMNRRDALGLAGLALLAAGCGGTSGSGGSGSAASGLASKPVGDRLVIYNWAQYDDPKTYKDFQHANAGLKVNETYYSSNDELLAKLQAGGSGYDIVVPSQNAVAELIQLKKLYKLDKSLLPNYANLDPAWTTTAYDPGGQYSVVKDYGITMFFYRNDVVKERPQTMYEFYELFPKYGKQGRTNLLDGAEEVVPLALMALGIDPNTGSDADFAKVKKFLLSIRRGVTTITASSYIADASAGKIILGQGWNGDIRRIVTARKKHSDITAVIPHQMSEKWADNWCILANSPHPRAAHVWLNFLLEPSIAAQEMRYHNYAIPMPKALALTPKTLKDDPLFNIPKSYTDNYRFILNVSPTIVNKRTQIYSEFKAA